MPLPVKTFLGLGPTYRIAKAGFFMGKYYAEGTELNLHEKQAKYAVLSGQLERVGEHAKPAPKAMAAGPVTPSIPAKPSTFTRRTVTGSTYRGESNTKR